MDTTKAAGAAAAMDSPAGIAIRRAAIGAAVALAIALLAVWPRCALAQTRPGASPTPFVLSGEQEYLFHCASCHGLRARGDGPAAHAFRVRPPDLTLLASRNGGVFPEQHVFATIDGSAVIAAHGTREMPVWGQIFEQQGSYTYDRAATSREVRERIQRLVDYLKSVQRK
ncbi:MAG TPA: c-type cytochrome [Candidatus Binataceae bacterium]|jgi:mono/diheme cytochrome c family protein|nr:c-type cytochrome [Candidatus Binataceae bacterium]